MPQTRTPLRYPGGKTQLTKFVQHTIEINNMVPELLLTFYLVIRLTPSF